MTLDEARAVLAQAFAPEILKLFAWLQEGGPVPPVAVAFCGGAQSVMVAQVSSHARALRIADACRLVVATAHEQASRTS